MSSGIVGGAALLAEQYQIIEDAYRAEGVPLANAHITVNRFAHIIDSKEDGLRFAENARYQSRLASSSEGMPMHSASSPSSNTVAETTDGLAILQRDARLGGAT